MEHAETRIAKTAGDALGGEWGRERSSGIPAARTLQIGEDVVNGPLIPVLACVSWSEGVPSCWLKGKGH